MAKNKYRILVYVFILVAGILVGLAIRYIQLPSLNTNEAIEVNEEYATKLADTIRGFLYFMSLEAISTRVPSTYVVPSLMPVLSIPTPGIKLLDSLDEKMSSYTIYTAPLGNTTFTVKSSSSGKGALEFTGVEEINGSKYYDYKLSYHIDMTRVSGNRSSSAELVVNGNVSVREDFLEMVFNGVFNGSTGNASYVEYFKTIVFFDKEYRPIKITVFINNSSTPSVDLFLDYKLRKANVTIAGMTTTMDFGEYSINFKVDSIDEEEFNGKKFYLIRYRILSNNTDIGSITYIVSSNGIPVTVYETSIKMSKQTVYGSMVFEFTKRIVSFRPRS